MTVQLPGQVSAGARHLSLSYDPDGRLASSSDHTSRAVQYGYDFAGYLVSATDVLGQVWSYAYDVSHRLAEITDPRGIVVLRLEYDLEGEQFGSMTAWGHRIIQIRLQKRWYLHNHR